MNASVKIPADPSIGIRYYPCQRQQGSLHKVPLVLVHGWGADSHIWGSLPQQLSQWVDIITLDLPGFGDSAPIADYSESSLLGWLGDALPSYCSMLGLSLGGMLCRSFAHQYPERVSALITIGSNRQFVASKDYPSAMAPSDFNAFIDSWQTDPTACLKRFIGLQAQGDQQQRQLMRELRSYQTAIDHRSGQDLLKLLGALRSPNSVLQVPVLNLLGEQDALVPLDAAQYIDDMGIIPGAGHLPHLSAPAQVLGQIERFMDCQRYQPDKPKVAESFGRAAAKYDRAAQLQHRVGEQLLDSLSGHPSRIVDLGCGTGYHSAQLQQRFPKAHITGVDLSPGMLAYAESKHGTAGLNWLCGDAEALPLSSGSQSLIFSNFALQWCGQLRRLARELFRVLEPQGQLVFAVPGPDTLLELRQAWAQVDGDIHVNHFASLSHWEEAFASAGFCRINLKSHRLAEQHQSVRALLLELKEVGAHNNNIGKSAKMTGKQRLKALYNAYEQYRLPNGEIPATWEIISGVVTR
jgi:malonyl-CoA O-methyltransferase